MSLDNIQLPPAAIASLYKKTLVEVKAGIPEEKKNNEPPINVLGKNNKGILIIVNNTEAVYLPDEELNFLLGILNACRLNMDEVGIVNLQKNTGVDYKKLSSELHAEKLFLFGVAAADIQLPLSFPHYQAQKYNNQVYLTAPALLNIQNDKAEKTKLWSSLKQIFSI